MRVPRPDAVFYPTDYLVNARLKRSINSCLDIVYPNVKNEERYTCYQLLDLAVSILSSSSAAYHNLEHTALVTQCGLDIIEAVKNKEDMIFSAKKLINPVFCVFKTKENNKMKVYYIKIDR